MSLVVQKEHNSGKTLLISPHHGYASNETLSSVPCQITADHECARLTISCIYIYITYSMICWHTITSLIWWKTLQMCRCTFCLPLLAWGVVTRSLSTRLWGQRLLDSRCRPEHNRVKKINSELIVRNYESVSLFLLKQLGHCLCGLEITWFSIEAETLAHVCLSPVIKISELNKHPETIKSISGPFFCHDPNSWLCQKGEKYNDDSD